MTDNIIAVLEFAAPLIGATISVCILLLAIFN